MPPNTLIPEDCALVTRAVGDAMYDRGLPMWERLEFDDEGLLITVEPEHFETWRKAFGLGVPGRSVTPSWHKDYAHGRIEGVPLVLEAWEWKHDRRTA